MTAETVLEGVLLEIGLDRPTAQLTDPSYEIRQIKQFMNAAGKDVAFRTEWSRMTKSHTVGGNLSEDTLPGDFHKLPEKGAVRLNKADFHPVRPVVAPEQWHFLSVRPSTQPYYHLSGGKILFSPALDADGAVMPYISKFWVEGKAAITQNGDNLLIPDRLVEKGAIWRWKRQKGQPYDDLLAEYEADILVEIDADRGAE
ncbi:MAG: hypothetical protein JJ979_05775 [Roseibium sp.]|nr:hypothetical protein [Roseibium sp.]